MLQIIPVKESIWTLDAYPPGKRRGKPIWKNVSSKFISDDDEKHFRILIDDPELQSELRALNE